MNTAVTSRLSRWAAGVLAVALVAGGSIIATAPAYAAPATVTGGSLDWGVAADYRAVFTTRGNAAGATVTAADTFSFPAATTSTYDVATKKGTLNFTGNARIGYFAGAPFPGATPGNYFYISNPVVTLDGVNGTISGQVAGDSHSINPELPTAPLAMRTIANLDLTNVSPVVNAEGTLVTLTSVPATITADGANVLAQYGSAGDAAATKRAAGSALDPLTVALNVVAPPAAVRTATVLTVPATATVGTAVALSAAVTPADAAGSVQFFDGATSLATVPVASGVASYSATFAAASARPVTAVFTPSDAALFTPSTSAATTVTVSAAPVVTPPVTPVPPVTTGSLDWGIAADYRKIFATRAVAAGATLTAADTFSFPAASTSTYNVATKTGTLNFTGNARIGYFAGPPLPGVAAGNYFYISNPVVTLNGTTGTISGQVAGDSHSMNPELPKAALAVRTVANLDLSAVTPVVNAAGTSVTLSAVPATITADGASVLARYGSADDAAATKRPVDSALDPVTLVIDAVTPKVVVSKTTVSASGETVTVTGTGFSPQAPATTATRPPLAGKFGGAYVTFGKFADVWKASEGAGRTARTADELTTKWVVNGDDIAGLGAAGAAAVPINADGSFSIEVAVKPGFAGEPATGNYGIYTYPGSGANFAPFETYTPITFVSTPTVTVSKTTVSANGETVTVTGTGFSPQAPATTGTRPPLAGKFGGAYVTFGKFADVWKPSEGAGRASRTADGLSTRWVVNGEDIPDLGDSASSAVPINADGSFSIEVAVKPGFAGEPATGNYGIYTYPGSGANFAPFETYTPVTFVDATTTTTTTLTADPTTITAGASTTLTAQVAPIATGSYAFTLGSTQLGTVAASATGAASFTVQNLPVGTQQLTATFTPSDTTIVGSTGTTTVQVNAVAPATPPVVAPPAVGAGSLTWGVKQSFRDYIVSKTASGEIVTSGVSTSGGAFVFSQASGGSFDRATGTGTSAYSGSVRFTGHNGLLDVTLANPVVRVDSASSGTLLVTAGGRQIAFATLNLSAGSLSTPNNTVSYSGVPATLTTEGVAVFALNGSGFYPAGTALDPVSFVIGAPSVSASTGSATVASFASVTKTPAKTVPATTGITVSTTDGSPLVEGGEVTITADGFQPNEKNILVVIYSDPVVLASNATADARGTVTWTGRLPAGLSGTHTLTLQGSVDRGVEVTIAAKAATTAVAGCVVDDATLTWGFKESFRSYISGTIANGEWTVADGATYAVPDFGFSAGTGGYDPETGAGLLAYAGSIAFTGHGGLLNTTVSNPQLQLVDETSAILLLDISGTTQDGAAVDRTAVEFGSVDLTGAVVTENGVVTISSAPAVLTAAGADAFGTYPEGEALDPISATFSVADDCAQPVEESDTPLTTMAEGEADTAVAASDSSDFGWILWVVLALVLIAAAVAVVLVVRRKSATRS